MHTFSHSLPRSESGGEGTKVTSLRIVKGRRKLGHCVHCSDHWRGISSVQPSRAASERNRVAAVEAAAVEAAEAVQEPQ